MDINRISTDLLCTVHKAWPLITIFQGSNVDIQSLASEFWDRGYLYIENFFDDRLMDLYQEQILCHFGDNPNFVHTDDFIEKSKTDVIPWFPQQEGFADFDIAQQDPRLVALTEAILGHDWSSLYSMVMYSKKDTKGQAWHQDCPPEDKSQYNLNRLVYSMDIDASLGGQTLVVPGSHKGQAITVGPGDEHFPDQLVFSPKKGSILLLHGHIWHRVLPVTGDFRVSINYRCCPRGTPDNVTDIAVYRNMRYDFSTNRVVEERNEQTDV